VHWGIDNAVISPVSPAKRRGNGPTLPDTSEVIKSTNGRTPMSNLSECPKSGIETSQRQLPWPARMGNCATAKMPTSVKFPIVLLAVSLGGRHSNRAGASRRRDAKRDAAGTHRAGERGCKFGVDPRRGSVEPHASAERASAKVDACRAHRSVQRCRDHAGAARPGRFHRDRPLGGAQAPRAASRSGHPGNRPRRRFPEDDRHSPEEMDGL
jgi:hypothetical protein